MAQRGTAGIGGPGGTNPIGDRPGTTTLGGTGAGMWSTPAGRAQVIAVGCFVAIIFLHMAAENR